MFSLFRLLSANPSGAGSVSNSSGCESLLKSGIGLKDATLGVGLGQGEISKPSADSISIKLTPASCTCNKSEVNCCFLS